MWWLILPIALSALIAVIIIRALLFKPHKQLTPESEDFVLENEKIIERFSQLIQCKTISNRDPALVDFAEFDKTFELIKKFYPEVFKVCEFKKIEPTGLLFRWPGKNKGDPAVFMSHYDVVPVDEKQWTHDPFSGVVIDNELWGRGTLDTKGTLVGVLEAAEYLIKKGFTPDKDIYLSFAGDEEVAGPSAPAIVDHLEKKNIKPAMVIDEGGAVVDNVFPGVPGQCALIGIAEKGMMDVKMNIKGGGGHASAPPAHTLIGQLSQAVINIENNPFEYHMTPPVVKMFDTLGRHSTFGYKLIFANLWAFSFLLNMLAKKSGGEMNAMLRTTVAFTQAKGSDAPNVLASDAVFTANLRLMKDNPPKNAVAYLKKVANNDKIEFDIIHSSEATIYSDTECTGYENVKTAIAQTWPEAMISPYLMFAASDSRHFCKITDKVYKFSAMKLTSEQRSYIHGHNERIPLDSVYDAVKFFIRLMKLC